MKKLMSAVAAVALAFTGAAHAAIIIDFEEVGNDVVMSFEGTLTGITATSTNLNFGTFVGQYINPAGGQIRHYGPSAVANLYSGGLDASVTTIPFGTGPFRNADSFTGDIFGIYSSVIVLPGSYSGANISGTSTFEDVDIATMGLTPGTYVHSVGGGSDSISINVVPEPTGAALLLGAVSLLAFRRRK